MADFFHTCGVSFLAVEHPKAVEMFRAFRPSFKPPSRNDIGGRLLEESHNRAVKENKPRFSGKDKVTMLVDGWKNSSANKKILTAAVQAGKTVALVKSFDTTENREMGDTLAQIAEKTRDVVNHMYSVDSTSIVTDGAANMRNMGQKVSMVYNSCQAHVANLLMSDIA